MSDPTIPPSDPNRPIDYRSVAPPAPVTDPNARTWGMIAHLSALAGFAVPLGNILGPLVVYLVKKDEIPFVADQAKEALNFNITWSIALLVALALICVFVGFFLAPLVGIFMLVMSIIAGLKANNGEWYRYPATLRLVK